MQTLDQQLGGCLEDGFVLGLGDEREAHVQTDTAVTHHRVHLMQGFATLLDFLDGYAQFAGNLFLLFLGLGHELVERRVQKAEDDGLAVHDLQRALDGGLHVRLQVGQSGLALLVRVAENHLAQFGQRGLGILAVEHVLDTEQADAFGTELEGLRGILGRIGIGADTNLAELVHHIHELDEERILGSIHRADLGAVNQTLRAVQRQPVAFTIDLAAFGEGDGLVLEIDLHGIATHDAAFTPAAGHEGCVGGHTAPHGQDTGRGTHAFDIFRGGLFADQDGLLAGSGGFHGSLGGKDDGADGSTRGSGQALGQDRGFLLGGRVEDRVQDFIQLGRGDPHHGGLFVDHAFFHHIGRHLQGGQTGTLADTALQHPQVTFLDGEFDILHILEVIFQFQTDFVQLLIYFGHRFFERYQIFVFLALGRLIERVRGPDTGYHILALGVDQPFTIELVVTVGRVAGERHTRSGGFAHVAEHHGLHVHGRSPIIGNLFNAAISDGAFSVPGLEHAADGAPQLGFGGIREFHAEHFLDPDLEGLGELFQLIGSDLGIALVSFLVFEFLHHAVQLLADALAVGRLDAFGFLHHHVGVHHDQTAVGVIHETRVAGLLDHARKRGGAKADVEDGIHHARHGGAGTGTAAHQQRVVRIAEFLAHDLFRSGQGIGYLALQLFRIAAAECIVFGAALRRNGETGRYRHAQTAHFSQVGSLSTQELTHVAVTLGLLAAKGVNSFLILKHIL